MSRIADQVEELEDALASARDRIQSMAAEIEQLEEEVETLNYDMHQMQQYIEWFEATYPEARTAYEVAQRVST